MLLVEKSRFCGISAIFFQYRFMSETQVLMTISDFFVFFLGIISWKGALLFNGGLHFNWGEEGCQWETLSNGPCLWTGLTCFQVLCHCWTVDYFHCYLNQMSQPIIHYSYIFRIENDWEYWLNYSNDLLVKLIEATDILSYQIFLNTGFCKLV